MAITTVRIPHVRREHPRVDEVPKMATSKLWRYVLGELEFLSTDEQKRVPRSVAEAMRELSRRDRSK